MRSEKEICIIGGGAAGIMAALSASMRGASKITILERMDRIGKKILATGNGRCNFTNEKVCIKNYYGKNPKFVESALKEFNVSKTISFFEKIGVISKTEEKGRIFPYSGQSSAILDALRNQLYNHKINIVTNFEAAEITKQKNVFKITSAKNEKYVSDKLIIAAGGCSAPELGSNGSGFKIMEKAGYTISKLHPALVQLKTDAPEIKSLQGIKINGYVYITDKSSIIAKEYGEILFTSYGFSGPPIFQSSVICPNRKNLKIIIDLAPEYNTEQLIVILKDRKEYLKNFTMEHYFNGFLNKRIGNIISKRSGIEKLSFPIFRLTDQHISAFVQHIKNFKFNITGDNGFKNSQVTAGGLLTSQFEHSTMESKKTSGLYVAGEILDIYGDCGGYNLQWAWSSGFVAGKSAAESL